MLKLFATDIDADQFLEKYSYFNKVNITSVSEIFDGVLFFKDGKLNLRSDQADICTDLVKEYMRHIDKKYSIKKEPLAKALGIKGNFQSKILDLTFGTGKDSMLLLHFGAEVISFERNEFVSVLGSDAYLRFTQSETLAPPIKKMFQYYPRSVEFTDLENLDYDAIYFDPMYPEKSKKTALARKEIEAFKSIVGADLDSKEFITSILKNCKPGKRVIIKRPISSEFVLGKPTASFEGKTTRYDLYMS